MSNKNIINDFFKIFEGVLDENKLADKPTQVYFSYTLHIYFIFVFIIQLKYQHIFTRKYKIGFGTRVCLPTSRYSNQRIKFALILLTVFELIVIIIIVYVNITLIT